MEKIACRNLIKIGITVFCTVIPKLFFLVSMFINVSYSKLTNTRGTEFNRQKGVF